jgi:hypothetical protein
MGRMWMILEFVVLAAVALLAITEFFYPLIAGKPLFGSFRKKPAPTSATLDDEIEQARRKAEEVKDVQRKAEEKLRDAAQRKREADDLLK